MNHSLLVLFGTSALLLSFSPAAQAQASLAHLVGAGVGLAARSSASSRQQKATLFVTPASYQAHAFAQKRTPPKKLPKAGEGGTEIIAIEQLLADRFAALQADSTKLLLGAEQEKSFGHLRTNLEAFNPFWNTDPYSEEMNFYRAHDASRQRTARPTTK